VLALRFSPFALRMAWPCRLLLSCLDFAQLDATGSEGTSHLRFVFYPLLDPNLTLCKIVHCVLLACVIQLCKSRQDQSRRQGPSQGEEEKAIAAENLSFGFLSV